MLLRKHNKSTSMGRIVYITTDYDYSDNKNERFLLLLLIIIIPLVAVLLCCCTHEYARKRRERILIARAKGYNPPPIYEQHRKTSEYIEQYSSELKA
jgi:hypothetical protein